MTWEIKIPFQSRDQTITEALAAGVDQAIEPGEDRDVTTQILLHSSGTMGELLDHLGSLDTEGQRRILDGARKAAGLEASEDIDDRERFERYNRSLPPGSDAHGRRFVACAEPNCHIWPTDEQGAPTGVVDRVWWCDQHRHLAGSQDHLAPEPKYEIDFATMGLKAIAQSRNACWRRIGSGSRRCVSARSASSKRPKPWTPLGSATSSRPRRTGAAGRFAPTAGSSNDQ